MYNIKPNYVAGANCFENSVITVANYYRNTYELLLGDTYSLKFSLENNSDKLSDRISFYDAGMLEKIEKYYGIQVYEYTNIEIKDMLNYLKNKIILLIEMDTYYCPQTVQYHKYHNKHACLAIDNTQDSIICIDVNIGIKKYEISFADIEKGIKKLYGFKPQKNYTQCSRIDELKKSINNIISLNIPQNILLLRDALSNVDLLENEILGYEKKYYTINPLILLLSQIGGRRSLYAKYLDFYTNLVEDIKLNEAKDLLLLSSSKWYTWRANILIAMFNNNISMNTIKELQAKLNEIYIIETQIINILKNIEFKQLKEKSNDSTNDLVTQNTDCQMYFVNMDMLFNNCGNCINLNNEEIDSGLTYDGEIFCDKKFQSNKEIEVYGIKYHLGNQNNNNVSCSGQLVTIKKDNYQKICILGCEENGNYFGYIELHYPNTIIKKPIQLSDWTQLVPKYDDKLAMTARAGNIHSEEIYKSERALFSLVMEIYSEEPLIKVVLPNCEHIHIFAITLIKNKTEV